MSFRFLSCMLGPMLLSLATAAIAQQTAVDGFVPQANLPVRALATATYGPTRGVSLEEGKEASGHTPLEGAMEISSTSAKTPALEVGASLGVGALAKNTHDGATSRTPLVGSHQGWLGICRIGSTFGLITKLDGAASATVLEQVSRPDLGATLQVGMITGSWVTDQRDVVGRFDSVHFSVPSTPMDCEACLME